MYRKGFGVLHVDPRLRPEQGPIHPSSLSKKIYVYIFPAADFPGQKPTSYYTCPLIHNHCPVYKPLSEDLTRLHSRQEKKKIPPISSPTTASSSSPSRPRSAQPQPRRRRRRIRHASDGAGDSAPAPPRRCRSSALRLLLPPPQALVLAPPYPLLLLARAVLPFFLHPSSAAPVVLSVCLSALFFLLASCRLLSFVARLIWFCSVLYCGFCKAVSCWIGCSRSDWIGLDWITGSGIRCSLLLFWQASSLMDGRSCGLGRVPAVASDGASSVDARGTDIPPEKHSALDGASQQTKNADGSLEAGISVDDLSKPVSLGVKKGLQKCVTFPPSTGEVQQEDSCCDPDETPKDALTYQRSVSLPPTTKLISAMKGSRQKNGMASPTENRRIKWAPDVYDPPVTSVCHSVNNSYQRRSKPRKKDKNKQKQKQKQKQKGSSKKKNRNTTQNSALHQTPGLKDLGTSSCGPVPVPDDGKHEFLDYGISSQEAKCGSSFLRETVAKMHFSTAEAS